MSSLRVVLVALFSTSALCFAAYYYGKKRKLSKPMGGEETAEGELAKPTRRRKKRKAIFVQKKRRSSAVDYTPAGSPQVRLLFPGSMWRQQEPRVERNISRVARR